VKYAGVLASASPFLADDAGAAKDPTVDVE
jgi:hypothetical protein